MKKELKCQNRKDWEKKEKGRGRFSLDERKKEEMGNRYWLEKEMEEGPMLVIKSDDMEEVWKDSTACLGIAMLANNLIWFLAVHVNPQDQPGISSVYYQV